MTHTQGHWIPNTGTLCVDDSIGDCIAIVSIANRPPDEALANASLIATAPELLVHLEELVSLCECDIENTPGNDLYIELELAKDVIRRARNGVTS